MEGTFAKALLGRSEGDIVEFGNGFVVIRIDSN